MNILAAVDFSAVTQDVMDALRRGLRVSVVQDGLASINARRGAETLHALRVAGAEVVSSGQAIMALFNNGEAHL